MAALNIAAEVAVAVAVVVVAVVVGVDERCCCCCCQMCLVIERAVEDCCKIAYVPQKLIEMDSARSEEAPVQLLVDRTKDSVRP